MAKIPKVTVTFDADLDSLKKGVKSATTDVDSFGTKVGDFSKKAALAFAAVAAAVGAMAIKIGTEAVKAASDLGETISKVNVIFGDTAKDIEKFAEGAATSLGQTKQQALDAAATFATFGKAAGLSGRDLTKFSTDFVSLASDLASFNNTSPEAAINAIGSALRGEAEPLRQYGVLLDDASLRQAALELGIISTTKNALTPQQKVLAAQALIYKQTGAAQGDFERTSDGLANKTRILTAEMENAKVQIGEALLPVITEIATFIGDNVIPVIQQFTNGLTAKGGLAEGLTDSEKAALKWGERIRGLIETVINFKDELLIVAGVIATIFVANKIAAGVTATIALIKLITAAYVALRNTALAAAIASRFAVNPFLGLASAAGIAAAIYGATKIFGKDDAAAASAGAPSTGAIPFASGFAAPDQTDAERAQLAAAIAKGEREAKEFAATGKIGGTTGATTAGSTSGTVATVVANAAAVTDKAGKVVTDIAGAFDNFTSGTTTIAGVNAASTSAFPFGTSGVNTNTLAGIMAASGTTINVTVNGAIDSEGTARTIVDTLNNSFYRGTGGATGLVAI